MDRKYVTRGKSVEGVFQRCNRTCPARACNANHNWRYSIELPAVDGHRRVIRKGGFPTGKDAEEARAEVLRKHRKGTQPKNPKLTVAQWLTKWLLTQETVRGLGDGTIIDYRRHVEKYWIPAIGQIRLSELKPSDVTDTLGFIVTQRKKAREEALEHNRKASAEAAELDKARVAKGLKRPVKAKLVLVPRPLGAGTVQRIHATLRAALNAAVRAEEVDRNVAAQAEKPRYRRKKVKPWQPEQLGEWLDSITGLRMYPLFHLGAFAGMRRGELIGLSWDDVDLDNGQATVHWQITLVSYAKARKAVRAGGKPQYRVRTKTADGEGRTIDLDPQTVHELRTWRKQQLEEMALWGSDYQNRDNLVFTKENGEPYDPHRVYKAFVASVARLGLKPQPLHMLRHLAASLLIAAGVDIAIVSKRLGHSKIDLTVDTYGHLIGKGGRKAANAAARLVPRGRDNTKNDKPKKGKKKDKQKKSPENDAIS